MAAPKRNRSIKIRLTDDELSELNRKKTRAELARWVREIALGIEQPKSRKVSSKFPPEVARILAGMGNNLNQIAKQLNSAAKTGVIENMQVIRAITEVAAAERSLNALREYLAGREGAEK